MNTDINISTAVTRYGKEHAEDAEFLRSIAFIIDENPEAITDYYDHPAITRLIQDRSSTCLDRTKRLEALAYGDAGAMLACPGPSLSGLILREIGTVQQQKLFFDYVAAKKARTFLAVTEPNKGSDAGAMQARLQKDVNDPSSILLSGEKWLVGNGALATIGIVMARTSAGPLGITAALIMPDQLSNNNSNLFRTTLPMLGLRGAQLSYLSFQNFSIKKENLLGQHLNAMSRGMMAVIKTFNRMRPCVGALALGTAQAILDYIDIHRRSLNKNEEEHYGRLTALVQATRELLHKSARAVEKNSFESALISAAKIKATHVAEKVAAKSLEFFGQGALLEHPRLEKWYRDVFGFEYMEGTTDIQKKNIAQGYLHGSL
jgi:acyl-CoA dehydrogenase